MKYIDLRTIENFYGVPSDCLAFSNEPEFEPNKFPNLDQIFSFNIGELIRQIPRTYQTELYACIMNQNSIVYLPTGSGKTLIAAMVTAHMKKLNPNKKVFFVCDRVPLVFQQANYLRTQTGLNVRNKILAKYLNNVNVRYILIYFDIF